MVRVGGSTNFSVNPGFSEQHTSMFICKGWHWQYLTNHANITEWLTLQMKYKLLSEKYKEGGAWRTQSHPKWFDSLHSVHTQVIILVAWHSLAFKPGSWFLLTAWHIGPTVYWNRRGKITQLLPDVSWPASPGTAPWTCHSTPPLQLTHRPHPATEGKCVIKNESSTAAADKSVVWEEEHCTVVQW